MFHTIEDWLLEQGGPAIRLRMSNMKKSNNLKNNVDASVSALLAIDEVHSIINNLDGFHTMDRDKKTLEHLIHYFKDTCIENYFLLIMDMGLKTGIPIFDKKMEPVKDIFKYLYTFSNESVYCYYFTLMLHRFLFMSDCLFPEVLESMEKRINAIHKAAEENLYDIYQDESKLPKRPQIWADISVIKDELNPFNFSSEKPLPNIYDIWALAYYSNIDINPEKMEKINDIITYILTPEFQMIREGFGLIWDKARRTYYSCGWSPTLPLYVIEGHPIQSVPFSLLDYLDFMSYFKAAHKSKWFQDFLNHFEQFRTEKGTYIFPNEYLHKKYIDKAFLNDSNMLLKRNERALLKRELVSTMKMVEICGRVKANIYG